MRRRICLITPMHLATNPRLVKEADALAEHGYEVSVIAGDCILWAREADRAFETRPWRVARRLTFGPLAPLPQRLIQVSRQKAAALLFHAGIAEPHVRRAAWHPIGPDLARAACKIKADLYIAHYIAALPAAAVAAKRHGARYAFDAEDFHLGDLPDTAEHADKKRIIRDTESFRLPGAAYVTAASPGIADAYAKTYGIPEPVVILNVFPLSHAPESSSPAGVVAPGPSLYWFSQTIGPDRGLQCAIRAIGLSATKPHLYLRGTPARGFEQELRRIAAESGVAERIHFLPPAPPSELERLAAKYDLGLSGEIRDTRNRQIALANKLFTYLLAGIPIVLSDIPAHQALAKELGEAARLYAVDDPSSLAAALDGFLSDPVRLREARARSFSLGQRRFNWDCEKKHLLALVDRTLAAA